MLMGVAEQGKRGGRGWIGEGIRQGTYCDNGCVSGGVFRHRKLVREKLHCFGGALGSGLQYIKLVAAIVFGNRT